MLRLICLSDTHGLHRQIAAPHGDVLIIAGDLTRHGQPDELPDLNDWLGTLPHAHKLLIAGNHDFICEQQPQRIPQLLSNATYLCDTTIEIAGIVCFGSPWTPGGGWAFSRSLNALAYRWAEIPEHTDVLITHGPPLGTLDQNARASIWAARRWPRRCAACGHICTSLVISTRRTACPRRMVSPLSTRAAARSPTRQYTRRWSSSYRKASPRENQISGLVETITPCVRHVVLALHLGEQL